MATASNGTMGGRPDAPEKTAPARVDKLTDGGSESDSLRINIPDELPGQIRRMIEETGPGVFRSVEVGLEDDERFLLISVELSPTATRRGIRTTQTADLLRDVMDSYSPSPIPSNRWICEIALPDGQESHHAGGLAGTI